ncbi:hypothetical protein PUR61_29245 [Streptomyces sp. BE20]|uniref:hypothetical protein n=1 Tax=Streptomyces sp. BE20 TaxID=3002525 RepID=UPI002E7728D0|nr:hypothetical protein [Streptomyces sp. BE20]MEE1826243.1 hypothetical protein [Streptomyces sp. BE20]
MLTRTANGDTRLSFWQRVREFAVPPTMIETSTARRLVGDWAGACAAAGVDVDLDLRSVARAHGSDLAALVRGDLRHLAPDLLRWHLPRVAPDGLLRPGLTVPLARYGAGAVQLVVRTPPAWADAGQRIGLALWDASRAGSRDRRHPHPHPHPHRRFRFDLHRHLWDARRAHELGKRAGADRPPADRIPVPPRFACAVDRWAAEAGILLRAEGRPPGAVAVRLGSRQRLVLDLLADGVGLTVTPSTADRAAGLPVLPDAATWVLPDPELLRAGLIRPDRLHPLVAAALAPGHRPAPAPAGAPDPAGAPHPVECRGALHRIGLVGGVLVPLDHDPAEIRREELLASLTGTPLPCLQVIDRAHRHPENLDDVRARLAHGDTAGALAVVEGLLGPEALLRDGALRDDLEEAARRRIVYGLFRAGLVGSRPEHVGRPGLRRSRGRRSRPRHADSR